MPIPFPSTVSPSGSPRIIPVCDHFGGRQISPICLAEQDIFRSRHADIDNMDYLRGFLGGLLLLFGLYVIGCSYVRQLRNYRNRNQTGYSWSSPVPFVGPLLAVIGWTILPTDLSAWVLLLFVADPDTVIFALGLPGLMHRLLSRS